MKTKDLEFLLFALESHHNHDSLEEAKERYEMLEQEAKNGHDGDCRGFPYGCWLCFLEDFGKIADQLIRESESHTFAKLNRMLEVAYEGI